MTGRDVRTATGTQRPRAVIFAYSAQPNRGSEPGAGWAVVRATARFADCVVLVKSDHIDAIRAWEREHPDSGLEFVQVDSPLPSVLKRGHRIGRFITYLAWLRAAARVARQRHEADPFDFAQHATYAAYWLPAPAVDMGIPSIWGPVAGGVTAPVRLWGAMGLRGLLDELLDFFAIRLAAALPRTRRTWRRATVRIVQNGETRQRLSRAVRRDTHVLSVASFHEITRPPVDGREPYVVFPSALVARKCPQLAVRALVDQPGVRLVFAHSGAMEPALKRLVRRLRLEDRVDFRGAIPRGELFEVMAMASAVLFTGIREEGGAALAEAMLLGTPVVVLGIGGARTIALRAVDPSRVALVEPASSGETARRLGESMAHFVRHPVLRRDPNLDVDEALGRYRTMLATAAGVTVPSPDPAPPSGRKSPATVEIAHA